MKKERIAEIFGDLLEWMDEMICDDEELLRTFLSIGMTEEEIRELGYDYLLEGR